VTSVLKAFPYHHYLIEMWSLMFLQCMFCIECTVNRTSVLRSRSGSKSDQIREKYAVKSFNWVSPPQWDHGVNSLLWMTWNIISSFISAMLELLRGSDWLYIFTKFFKKTVRHVLSSDSLAICWIWGTVQQCRIIFVMRHRNWL